MTQGAQPIDIAANLANVHNRIEGAAMRAGRSASEITLVAVSKTKPFSLIEKARARGQLDFGENRLGELLPKVEEAKQRGLLDIRWHLIGTIQSRKTALAVGPFALIHSVDRVKIARRLSHDAQAAGTVMPVLLQINVSGEESKHGFTPDELLGTASELVDLPGIQVLGLMTMAPYEMQPELIRPVFRALRELQERLRIEVPHGDWRHLSMGMTNDFEVAIEEGATIVRIGSAVFGARDFDA